MSQSDFENELSVRLMRLSEDCIARLHRRPDEVCRVFLAVGLAMARRFDSGANIAAQLQPVLNELADDEGHADAIGPRAH